MFAADYVLHNPSLPDVRDREGLKQYAIATRARFPDFHITTEAMVAEGDKVARRYTFRGTHTGEYMGLPPTGKHVTGMGLELYHIAGGKIAECWWMYDALGLLQQLGVIPVPEPTQ